MRKSYPDADWRPAHPNNYSAGLNRPNKIIIHVAQGTWGSALNWFQNAAAGVAAHFTVATTGRVGQSLGDLAAGYHAGNWAYNRTSIGIEHAGYVDDPSWFTDEMYHASARLTAWLCKKYDIPVDREHILAHSQIPGTSHTDPGPHWNWPRYMRLVKQYRYPEADNSPRGEPRDQSEIWRGTRWQWCQDNSAPAPAILTYDGKDVWRVERVSSNPERLQSMSRWEWCQANSAPTPVVLTYDGGSAWKVTRI